MSPNTTDQTTIRRVRAFKLFSRLISVVAALTGFSVLVGWIFDIQVMISVVPGLTQMNPATAVCFLLSAFSLLTYDAPSNRYIFKWISSTCAFLVFSIAAIKTISFFGYDLGLDQILFREKLQLADPPNRMAPNTTLNFLLIGTSLLSLRLETRRGRRPSEYTALMSLAISTLALFGYIYEVKKLYGFASYIPMALNTALAFNFITVGILCSNPNRGLMSIITSENLGGRTARYLLPAVISVPIILSWLRFQGEIILHYYCTEFGISIMTVSTIIILIALVLWNARFLNKIDVQLKNAQEQLVRSERLAALGKFAGSLSHELRNPLAVITNAIHYLTENGLIDASKEKEMLDVIKRQAEAAKRIVENTLDFSNPKDPELKKANLNKTIERVIADIMVPNDIIVEREFHSEREIFYDPVFMKHVFSNIINNSIQAISARGKIKITSEDEKECVKITVEDTGHGIAKEDLDKIFEPLFSRKPKGVGLGLYIVKGIIERHKGSISIDSEVGKGTTATIKIPYGDPASDL